MRKTLGVSLLVLLLTGSASAGEMPFGSPTPPPPSQPSNAVQEPTNTAQDPTGGEISTGATDTLTQTVLDLLAVLPSLF